MNLMIYMPDAHGVRGHDCFTEVGNQNIFLLPNMISGCIRNIIVKR